MFNDTSTGERYFERETAPRRKTVLLEAAIVLQYERLLQRLGFRYSTSLLATSANRLAGRPLAKTTDGRREVAPRCFIDAEPASC